MTAELNIVSASVSDKGLSELRPHNEDAFIEMAHCGLYAVADGVGGAEGGEVASQMAVEMLSEAFTNKADGSDAEDILRSAIEGANAAIYKMANELPKLNGMATTIVALHIADNVATIGHVGDSRLYRAAPNGSLYRETEDHSMVAEEVRAGRMTEAQAENHPGRNVISRALGADPTVEADLKTILIDAGTSFLICSDGITRHINDDEIRKILIGPDSPADKCAHLKTLCFERGAEDNLTAVIVQVGDHAAKQQVADTPPNSDEEDTIATARVEDNSATASEERSEGSVFSTTGTFLSGNNDSANNNNGAFKTFGIAFGALLLGCVIGAALYHFMTSRSSVSQPPPQLSEMRSENIAFTSFEKLRRAVDGDPAAYLKETPPPQDAEDYYLQGRAYLLVGDFIKARAALLEAQNHIANAETSNAKVLSTDISTGLVITNDPEMQKRFRSEVEAAKAAVNSNSGP